MKKFCHLSPTMDEERLQEGVVRALNQYAANPEEITAQALMLAGHVIDAGEGAESLLELERKLEEVNERQSAALDRVLEDMTNTELNEQLRDLTNEKQRLLEQIEAAKGAEVRRSNQSARLRELAEWLEKQRKELTAYDESVTRRMVEKVTVVNEEALVVRIRDTGAEIEARIPARRAGKNPEQ